jgi:type VI secretion system secreted protein Hcp
LALYLKYGAFEGSATEQGHTKWIELDSFHWGVARGIGTAARGSTSREHSEPSISEITVTKRMDKASPKLFLDAVAGKLDSKVSIHFTTTNKGKVETFLKFELENTGISGYSVSSGGDMPVESLSLNFNKIAKTFTGFDPGISGSPETVGFDLTKMTTF